MIKFAQPFGSFASSSLYWRLLEYSTGIFEMIRKIAKARFLTTNIVNRIKRPESTRIYERSR